MPSDSRGLISQSGSEEAQERVRKCELLGERDLDKIHLHEDSQIKLLHVVLDCLFDGRSMRLEIIPLLRYSPLENRKQIFALCFPTRSERDRSRRISARSQVHSEMGILLLANRS